jgi:hypothetical protein
MKHSNLLRKKQGILLVLFFIVLHSLNSTEHKIDEIPVTLVGTVAIMQYYGPPNYGETPEIDSIEKYPVLTLQKPFAITIAGKEVCIPYIQIIRNQKLTNYPFIAGRNYVINGKIFLAQTGHHHTEVVLFTDSISDYENDW